MTLQHAHKHDEKSTSHKHGAGGAARILVVDDDPQIVKALKTSLEREGFNVSSAGDGMEAYSLIKAGTFGCMLLDIHMPRISGVELLLLMQAEGLHVPTIAMATFEDYRESEMKQFENVVKYLPKPFSLADMIAAVRKITA